MTARTDAPKAVGAVGLDILRSLNRLRFLTAGQLNRLLWPGNTRDRNRHAQRQLHKLVQDEYALVVGHLPTPNTPTAALVYTVGPRGRKALLAAGEPVPKYFRPSELAEAARNPWFMPHTLAVVDVLIAAERLTQASDTVSLTALRLERDLRQLSLKTTVPPAGARLQERRVTVVPDALFSLAVAGNRLDFVVELNRGTERRQKWRDKVAALTTWVTSPQSRTLFSGQIPSATVMVVTESPGRREQLRVWTEEELRSLGFLRDYGRIFAISCVSPVSLSPEAFFAQPHWWSVSSQVPKSLIDLPMR